MIEVQLSSSNTSIPARLSRLHTTSPARNVQPLDEQRDIGSGGRQSLAFDLEPARRNVAHRRRLVMFRIFDVDRAAQLDARHAPSLDRLTDKRAVDQRENVQRLVETDAQFAPVDPIDRSARALPIGEFQRDFAPGGGFLVGDERRAERRNLADRAWRANPESISAPDSNSPFSPSADELSGQGSRFSTTKMVFEDAWVIDGPDPVPPASLPSRT